MKKGKVRAHWLEKHRCLYFRWNITAFSYIIPPFVILLNHSLCLWLILQSVNQIRWNKPVLKKHTSNRHISQQNNFSPKNYIPWRDPQQRCVQTLDVDMFDIHVFASQHVSRYLCLIIKVKMWIKVGKSWSHFCIKIKVWMYDFRRIISTILY